MAEKRKLLAEMDRVFRKVDEGVDLFEDTMLKMAEANSDNQREKFQDDLKKEIKKLQRLRDNIKGWQNSNEVKDKDRLAQYRKTIEARMEQFKDIERENKTKPHSKQGLNAEEKLDPRERERVEIIEFLQDSITQLETQSEGLECQLEGLGGGGRKRKPDRNRARQEEDFRARLERHKFHVRHLELIMRLLNNETLDTAQVKDIRDDIEDFVARNSEDDFQENEFMYEDLNMGDLAQQLGSVTNIGTFEEPELDSDNSEPSQSPEPPARVSESSNGPKRPSKSKAAKTASSASKDPCDEGSGKIRHLSGTMPPPDVPPLFSAAPSKSTPNTPLRLTAQRSVDGDSPPSGNGGILYASKAAPPVGPVPLIPLAKNNSNHHFGSRGSGSTDLDSAFGDPGVEAALRLSPTKLVNGDGDHSAVPPLSSIAEQALDPSSVLSHFLSSRAPPAEGTQEATIPPILGASPLGKEAVGPEHKAALALLDAGTARLPLPMDSERLRPYLSRNPCTQPPYYAHAPPPLSDTLEYFNRLAPETLFFIFYYMEGTKAQYLAAKALKKQSWRFHKKYMMWFQRHEDPTAITDDYEQGTYVYFDFEKWAQRKKESFTFEYQYLEDRDLS